MSVGLPSVIAPPGEDDVLQAGPTSTRDSEPAVMSEFSSDTDPDVEDELCRFRPLQAAVSPLSTTSVMGLMPSSYLAPAVPVVPSAASSTQVSPAPIREEYSPGTLDVSLMPGGLVSMDNLLTGDSSLMDRIE